MRVVNSDGRSNSINTYSTTKHLLNPSYIDKHHLIVHGNVVIYDKIIAQSNILSCRFNDSASLVAIGTSHGQISIFDALTGNSLYNLSDEFFNNPCTSIRFVKGSSPLLIATYGTGLIKFWNYKTETCLRTIKETRPTMSQAIQPARERILTVGTNGDIFIYDVETGESVMHCFKGDQFDKLTGHSSRVFSAVYHPSTQHSFITGGWDDTILFWDDRSKHAFRKISGPHLCGESLDIEPTKNQIASASWRDTTPVQIWNFDRGTLIKDIIQPPVAKSFCYNIKWVSPDIVASGGSHGNVVNIISTDTNVSIASILNLPSSVNSLDVIKQGSKLKLAFSSQEYLYLAKIDL